MAIFAVLIPFLLLGVMLALGRYEELLLPTDREPETAAEPAVPAVPR